MVQFLLKGFETKRYEKDSYNNLGNSIGRESNFFQQLFLSKILVKNLRESFVGQIFNPLNDDRTMDWDKSFRISGNQILRVLLRLIKILIFIFIVLDNFSLVLFVEQC